MIVIWWYYHNNTCSNKFKLLVTKDENIGFNGYIGTWILLIYQRYIGEYFYMSIDISEINKNTLNFMEILYKKVKLILIIKYTH